jgi:phosphoglycerate dehydrogenase-like enzyme
VKDPVPLNFGDSAPDSSARHQTLESHMHPPKHVSVAVLDDFQGVAMQMADWSKLGERASITVFRDHISAPQALVERLRPFDVICVMRERTPLPRAILEQLPNLKLIASASMRNASIDMSAATELGITVCGTGSPSRGAPVFTWALILALLRNLPAELESMHKGGWQVGLGGDLHGKTLGLLGLGRLGSAVADIGKAFEMNAIAWSQNLTREKALDRGVAFVSKDELFRSADILTIHLRLSERTQGLVGAAELALMKPTAYLINTSRGPIVNEEALIAALKRRQIAGAGLDVYDEEPLPAGHPLRCMDNVIAAPHIGFVTRDTYRQFYGETVENVIAWLDQAPLRVLNAS